jgi:hypothetical protein
MLSCPFSPLPGGYRRASRFWWCCGVEDHRVRDGWRTAVAIRSAEVAGISTLWRSASQVLTVEERFASTTCGGAGGHTVSGRTFPWCVQMLRRYVDVLLVWAGRCGGKLSGLDFMPPCD